MGYFVVELFLIYRDYEVEAYFFAVRQSRAEGLFFDVLRRGEKCGAERTFSANSLEAAREFLNYDEIYLE